MAILRSVDGRFYEVPEDELDQYLVPADQVRDKLQEAGAPGPLPGGPVGGGPGGIGIPGGGQVHIHIGAGGVGGPGVGPGPAGQPGQAQPVGAGAEVAPYGGWGGYGGGHFHWHNCWRNCWRNCYHPHH